MIAHVVRRLEEKGYVERRTDPADKRRKLLFLAEKAEDVRPEIEELKATVDAEVVDGLTDEESRALESGLRTVSANLGVDLGASPDVS